MPFTFTGEDRITVSEGRAFRLRAVYKVLHDDVTDRTVRTHAYYEPPKLLGANPDGDFMVHVNRDAGDLYTALCVGIVGLRPTAYVGYTDQDGMSIRRAALTERLVRDPDTNEPIRPYVADPLPSGVIAIGPYPCVRGAREALPDLMADAIELSVPDSQRLLRRHPWRPDLALSELFAFGGMRTRVRFATRAGLRRVEQDGGAPANG